MKRKHAWLLILFALLAAGLQPIARELLQRPRTFVTDFRAIPNDGKDDTAAIKAAIVSAINTKTYHVHFPGGTWDIDSNNVLHPVTAGTVSGFGIKFTGDAQNYSILKLKRSAGNTRWFYDSDGTPGWNRVQFEHLWFQSDQNYGAAGRYETNGFRIWATTATGGIDKWFIFTLCRHNWLGVPLQFTGTSNTDSYNAYSCAWDGCGPIVVENDQAINLNWYSPHFWHSEDLFHIKATAGEGAQLQGGTGQISVRDADIIQESVGYTVTNAVNNGSGLIRLTVTGAPYASGHPFLTGDLVSVVSVGGVTAANGTWTVTKIDANTIDLQGSTFAGTYTSGGTARDGDPMYTVRIDDGAAFYRIIKFDGCKWELRGQQGRLVKWPGTASFLTGSHVVFSDCDMSVMQQTAGADTNGRRNVFSLGPHKRIVCERCYLGDQFGVEFTDVNTASVIGYGHGPLVELLGCGLPYTLAGLNDAGTAIDTNRGLSGRITLSNGYGRVRAVDCFSRDASNPVRYAIDFDYGGENAVRGEPGMRRKRVYLKTSVQGWPNWSGGTEFNARTLVLPENSRIVACGIERPASGSASTLIQYRIGNDDRTATYCATGPLRADGQHSAYADESTDPALFPIRVANTLNSRTVRLWMGPVEHGHSATGGEAWVEYE